MNKDTLKEELKLKKEKLKEIEELEKLKKQEEEVNKKLFNKSNIGKGIKFLKKIYKEMG